MIFKEIILLSDIRLTNNLLNVQLCVAKTHHFSASAQHPYDDNGNILANQNVSFAGIIRIYYLGTTYSNICMKDHINSTHRC